MQTFIASGRVADVPSDAVGQTTKGNVSFKFDFVTDSSLTDDNGKPIPSFFHVQLYGKQAEVMAQSLIKGSPILIKGEIVQRVYTNQQGHRRTFQYISPDQHGGITFLETKEAADQRRQAQTASSQVPFSESATQQSPYTSPYPEPMDAEEPF